MIKENAEKRNGILQRIGWANGTLRSAVSSVNVGEGIEGCVTPVKVGKSQARYQIDRLRQYLDELEKTL
jgi:hypothetical protein